MVKSIARRISGCDRKRTMVKEKEYEKEIIIDGGIGISFVWV